VDFTERLVALGKVKDRVQREWAEVAVPHLLVLTVSVPIGYILYICSSLNSCFKVVLLLSNL